MAGLRPPEQVMRLARMGASHQTRLSFMRTLLRRMASENWRFERLRFDVDAEGYGTSVYAAHAPERTYSLVAFTQALAPEQRTDRVIAEAWDATFNLFDGIPGDEDIARLAENTPKQEAGRFSANELSLARANKSLRAYVHVVESLAAGRQPDVDVLAEVGYLMRTTAVYGSGKFGCADREKIADRPETRGAFQVEMLSVYLIRWLTIDMVEHVARSRGGANAVPMDPQIKRYMGIGNSTGLGMAPFLTQHPMLVNSWVLARESALARVRGLPVAAPEQTGALLRLMDRVRRHLKEWNVENEIQQARIERLRIEMADFETRLAETSGKYPWDKLYCVAEKSYSLEGQELVASLLLEPHGVLIDDLADGMYTDGATRIYPAMTVAELRSLVEARYGWALERDYDQPAAQKRFWYYSEDKLEPRLGEREREPGGDREMPLGVARDVAALYGSLNGENTEASIAEFVLAHPEHRHVLRRVQLVAQYPYGEIYDSLIDDGIRPLDLLRFKLAFFGASKFDPKSDLWTRITMFQGAPMPDEIDAATADDWTFPIKPEIAA
tara:strand:+ start:1594 stop:3258 length:1665 start_codon:yes stop_codon:yes gene_type:complete